MTHCCESCQFRHKFEYFERYGSCAKQELKDDLEEHLGKPQADMVIHDAAQQTDGQPIECMMEVALREAYCRDECKKTLQSQTAA